MMPGRFVTFEGPEGSGKTTQARRLVARLQKAGFNVVFTREPGGTPTGELIRAILQYDRSGENIAPEAEVLLFAASRAQLVQHVIVPALQQGRWVVCDRFVDSTTVYQGHGRGFNMEQIVAINNFAINGAVPDVTLFLDVDVETGFSRLRKRHREDELPMDRIERESRDFHEKVRRGYLELATKWPQRIRTIDGARAPDVIEEEIWNLIENDFIRRKS